MNNWVKLLHGAREALSSLNMNEMEIINSNPSSPAFLLIMKSVGENSKMGGLVHYSVKLRYSGVVSAETVGGKAGGGPAVRSFRGKLCDEAFQYR